MPAREINDVTVPHIVQTGPGIHSANCPIDTGVCFPEGKAVRM
jgi:hypothetical protein